MQLRLKSWDARGTGRIQVGNVEVHEDDGRTYTFDISYAALSQIIHDDGSLRSGINLATVRAAIRQRLPAFNNVGSG